MRAIGTISYALAMARYARLVYAGIPHHVTQRGNRREEIFFTDENRWAYLVWLAGYCKKHRVDVAAYCLMPNHVHIVAIPQSTNSLERVFRPLHTRYAQYVNRCRGWTGHLLQGRYFSSPLDDAHFVAAVRYVERNPVRSQIVPRAEDYRWSSAAFHCGFRHDSLAAAINMVDRGFPATNEWSAWLAEADEAPQIAVLRRHIEANLPCGDTSFVSQLATQAGRDLAFRARGRPRKTPPSDL